MNDHRLAFHLDSWIALTMLVVAVLIAVGINHRNPARRTQATALAALSCLAAVGWFAAVLGTGVVGNPRPPELPTDGIKPLLLWILTGAALVGGLFLLRATLWQKARTDVLTTPVENTYSSYGQYSRYLHWTTAILFLSLIPMGIFATLIPEDVAWRKGYYVVHKTLGLVVLILLLARIVWNIKSPRPALDSHLKTWERRLAKVMHFLLYVLMLLLPVTGLVMSTYAGKPSYFFAWDLPLLWAADEEAVQLWGLLHKVVLPYLCYVVVGTHLLGALKHHFIDKRHASVHRMVS